MNIKKLISYFTPKFKVNIDYIQTYTGKEFWFPYPTIDMFSVLDEAHALSNLCRFGGHVSQFYGVGNHCVLASKYINSNDPYIQFEALHHEIEEAYMIDLPTPIKYLPDMIMYRTIAKEIKRVGRQFHQLNPVESPLVKEVDLRLLFTEKRDLMPKGGRKWKNNVEPFDFTIEPMSPKEAEQAFLDRHWELLEQINEQR